MAHAHAEKDGESVKDAVAEVERVDVGHREGREEGVPDTLAEALLDGVMVTHGEGVEDCETLREPVEYLLRDPPAKDSEALTEGDALLLPHAVAVADVQVDALSVGVAVAQMVALGQLEGVDEGVAQALTNDVGEGRGTTDKVAQPLTEAVYEAVKEGDEEALPLIEKVVEALGKGDGEVLKVPVTEPVAQGE